MQLDMSFKLGPQFIIMVDQPQGERLGAWRRLYHTVSGVPHIVIVNNCTPKRIWCEVVGREPHVVNTGFTLPSGSMSGGGGGGLSGQVALTHPCLAPHLLVVQIAHPGSYGPDGPYSVQCIRVSIVQHFIASIARHVTVICDMQDDVRSPEMYI